MMFTSSLFCKCLFFLLTNCTSIFVECWWMQQYSIILKSNDILAALLPINEIFTVFYDTKNSRVCRLQKPRNNILSDFFLNGLKCVLCYLEKFMKTLFDWFSLQIPNFINFYQKLISQLCQKVSRNSTGIWEQP